MRKSIKILRALGVAGYIEEIYLLRRFIGMKTFLSVLMVVVFTVVILFGFVKIQKLQDEININFNFIKSQVGLIQKNQNLINRQTDLIGGNQYLIEALMRIEGMVE